MVLDPRSAFPSTRGYVLKLHRDCDPAIGRWIGQLENMSSGRRYEFNTPEQLLACLTEDVDAHPVR